MADLQTVKMYSMYVIGEVESNWNWDSVNTGDPITVGMMQWFGSRAKNLLRRLQTSDPDGYALLAESLRTDLEGTHTDDWWSTRYLTSAEALTVSAALARDAAHTVQQDQWFSDVDGYLDQMYIWGFSLNDPKALIFCMSMYHQSPAQCVRVVRSAGGSAGLDRLYTTCLNDAIFSQYRNRYNTVYRRLTEWDGVSMPPDFGQNEGGTGGEGGTVTEIASLLGYIIKRGNDLYLYGKNEYAGGVVFHRASGDRWVNGYNANGTGIEGGNTGGGSASGSTAQNAIVQKMRECEGRFAYSQGGGRLSPDTSGYTDCSGMLWWLYWTVAGVDVNRNGTAYMLQQAREQGRIIRQGDHVDIGTVSDLQPADIVLIGWDFISTEVNHCELYMGDGRLWGQQGPGAGPTNNYDATSFGHQCQWWIVRYL